MFAGKGSFGHVQLVKDSAGATYALKARRLLLLGRLLEVVVDLISAQNSSGMSFCPLNHLLSLLFGRW
jgi:hypothetical protein